jgi:uncharacterized surface protein with fasciclin (FAS1) repeats
MTRFFRFFSLTLLLGSAWLLNGCSNDDDEPTPRSLYDLVGASTDLSLLKAAIDRAGIANDLRTGTLTLFAPTNAAFEAAGFRDAAAINTADAAVVRGILLYHAQQGATRASAIPTATNTAITMLNNGTAYVTKVGTNVSINGARVVRADELGSNGVMHVIDKVILPPAGTVVATLANATLFPNHTYLVAAVTRAATVAPTLAATVNGPGPLTIFAPTNAAFIDAGFPTITAINDANPQALMALVAILTNHVVTARGYSTTLTAGSLPTAGASPVTVALGPPVTLRLTNGGTVTANVTRADVTATNGVIHVIDKVLR